MPAYRVTLEYDGTDFRGWQIQPAVRTVAGVVRNAVVQSCGETPALTAAGRTDAGAHAHAQVLRLDLHAEWEPRALRFALNAMLPEDVAVVDVARCDNTFDARRDAVSRTYRYAVASREPRTPILRRHAWHVRGPLDVEAMRRAGAMLEGTHDFKAFGGPTHAEGTTVRTVHGVTVEDPRMRAEDPSSPQLVLISVSADAFLRGMMRAFAGALVAVGQGRRPVTWVAELLDADTAPTAALTVAPAHGLHQWSVAYAAPAAGAAA
jgi:tRNA pseudouridine38-40 synthase